ncbi:MAG: hypothetical protein AAGD11_19245 [Planctomycetota bacterium]
MLKQLLVSVAVLTALPSANADLVVYTGNPFATSSDSVTATFDFSVPLLNGATLTEANIISFEISAIGRTITNLNASFFDAEFTIGPSGLPTGWAFVAEADLEGSALPEQIDSQNEQNSVNLPAFSINFPRDGLTLDDTMQNSIEFGPGLLGAGNANSPGTWSAIPEPSSFICVGLVGILAVGCKRSCSSRS